MQTQSSFSGWDFSNIWVMYNGHTNPLLRSFMTPLTVTANSTSQVYNGLLYGGSGNLSYSTTPNMSNLFFGSPLYSGQSSPNVGSYTITPNLYSNQQGYIINSVGGSLTVTPAPLTVTASNASKTYGQTPALTGFGSSGLQNGETIGSVTETSPGAAGTASVAGSPYAITPSAATGGSFSASNYNITYTNGVLTVTPAALTVTASNTSKTYGQTPALTGFTATGLKNGETIGSVTEASAGAAATATVAGGPYTVTPSAATGGSFNPANYTISYTNGVLTVTPAPLTITADNVSKTYGQTAAPNGFTATGLQNGETVGSVTQTSAGAGATASVASGPYAITPSAATGGTFTPSNYSVSYANGVLTVTPAPLTITASDASKVYGQTPSLAGFTSSGLQNGETVGSVTQASAGTSATAGVASGPYAIVPSAATGGTFAASNYSISYANGALTVTPAPLTVTASDVSKTYGQTPALTGFTATGLKNGETIGSVTATSAGAAATASVAGGPYTITPSAATGGTFNPFNYSISYANGVLTVTPAPLTITASDVSKTYGQTAALSGFTATGLQNGETVGSVTQGSAGTSATAGVAGGPYAITPSAATGGTFSASNYSISYANGVLTVTPAPLTITASDVSKTYGEMPTLSGFTASGLQNGETVGSVIQSSAGTSATASVAGSPYAITPSAATGGTFSPANYSISYANGVLTVTPAPLTITAIDVTKTYGDTPSLTGFTASGLQNGENVGSVAQTSAGTAATASVVGGPYAITPSAATGGSFSPSNYSISYANGVLTVTPAPLAIAMDNQMKNVGDADPALTWSVTGGALLGGDVLSGSPTRAVGESAGNYAITGGTLANSNYSLAVTPGVLAIEP